MAKRKKSKPAAPAAADPGDALERAADAAAPSTPPGNPLDWPLSAWLEAAGLPLEKVREELEHLAAGSGPGAVLGQAGMNVWIRYMTPAVLDQGLRLALGGLQSLILDGKGEAGHAGAELA